MEIKEIIETLQCAKAEVEWNYPLNYAVAIDAAIEFLQLYKEEENPDELDCENCVWQEYAVGNKCVPCRLNKCNCLSKNMYEEREEIYD